MLRTDLLALRRVVLAVCVLDDVDLSPRDDGVVLPGRGAPHVGWDELSIALGGTRPEGDLARLRVRAWLRGRTIAAMHTVEELRSAARPVGLPVRHVLHPGRRWVRHRVHGGALDLGFGFVGLATDPDQVEVIPTGALDAAGIDPTPWWPVALYYLDRIGAVAAQRARRTTVLRPVGDCDVVTLLAAASFRRAVCSTEHTRMRAAAVPMRSRGWLDPSRIDPAFTHAAAAATEPAARGFIRPVLLTADEVAVAPAGGRPAEIVLRDAAVPHRI